MKAINGKTVAPLSKEESKDLAHYEHTLKGCYKPTEAFFMTLVAIKYDERKLWRGWGTFEGYVEALPKRMGWDDQFSRSYLSRIRKAAISLDKIARRLPIGNKLPSKESQLRALATASPDKAAETWDQAQKEEAAGGQKATASRLKDLLDKAGDPPEEKDQERAIDQAMVKWAKWLQRLRDSITKQLGRQKVAKVMGLFDDAWDELTKIADSLQG